MRPCDACPALLKPALSLAWPQDVRSLVRHISYLTRTLPDSEAPPPTATAAASGGESVGVALEAQQRDEALASPHVHW